MEPCVHRNADMWWL